MSEAITGLKLMRKPFEAHQISTMCRPTKRDNPPGKCTKCGGWHKVPAIQLSYVGHAALTDRLLDADPNWAWEPLAFAPDGTPFLDKDGGLWIKLTVAGVTRLGYGDAQGKLGGDAMKERIGDALRNAAMRFGAALDLWHKGDLHGDDEPAPQTFKKQEDGSFAKNPPPPSPARTENVQKPATKTTRKKAEASDYQPWGGNFGKVPDKPSYAADPIGETVTPVQPKPKATDFPFGENKPEGSPAAPEQVQPANQQTAPAPNIHGVVITDDDVPFPGDEKKDRPQTDAERRTLADRVIAIKKRHPDLPSMRGWMQKQSGEEFTNNIGFNKMTELVEKLEAAEKAGTLKELLL